jgi:CysZ protein
MIRGMLQMLDGLRLLLTEAGLRQVLWRMLALLVVLVLTLGAGVFWLADHLVHLWLPPGSEAWYWQIIGVIAWLLALALALISGAVGFVALASVATSPWLDMLAARTEALSGTGGEPSAAPWFAQITQSLASTLRPLVSLLALGTLASACLLVPVIGQVAATVIWGYAGIRFLNYALLDVPASRRQWDFSRRRGELGCMPWFYLGFGGTAMLMMLVPGLNLLVLPAAVVALSRRYAG